jgi:cell division protein FtsL
MNIRKLYLCVLLIILLCAIYFINKTEELTDLQGNEYNPAFKGYTQENSTNITLTNNGNAPSGKLNSIAVDKYGNIYVSSQRALLVKNPIREGIRSKASGLGTIRPQKIY